LDLRSSTFPFAKVILLVRQNVPDENFAAVKVDHTDQAVLLPANVEHAESPDLIGASVPFAKLRERLPLG
jgi:hypothetical protein